MTFFKKKKRFTITDVEMNMYKDTHDIVAVVIPRRDSTQHPYNTT